MQHFANSYMTDNCVFMYVDPNSAAFYYSHKLGVTVYEASKEDPSKRSNGDSGVSGMMRMTRHNNGVGEARTCGVSSRI